LVVYIIVLVMHGHTTHQIYKRRTGERYSLISEMSWLELLINRYFCMYLVVYIIDWKCVFSIIRTWNHFTVFIQSCSCRLEIHNLKHKLQNTWQKCGVWNFTA